MKSQMYERFLPENYQRTLFTEYINCRKGSRTVDDYADDFHRLAARSELKEREEQMIARFIFGLRLPIQDRAALLSTYSLADSMNRASQIEKQLSRSARPPYVPTVKVERPSPQPFDNGKGLLGDRPRLIHTATPHMLQVWAARPQIIRLSAPSFYDVRGRSGR